MDDLPIDPNAECKHCKTSFKPNQSKFFRQLGTGFYCSEKCLVSGSAIRESEREESFRNVNEDRLRMFLMKPKPKPADKLDEFPMTGEKIDLSDSDKKVQE